jgi:hypothetical protein
VASLPLQGLSQRPREENILFIGLLEGMTFHGEAHLPDYCCAMVTEEGFADCVLGDLCLKARVVGSRGLAEYLDLMLYRPGHDY